MKRVLLLALLAALVMPYSTFAQGKPNFAGTWTLDAAKSDPAPAGRGGGGAGGAGGGGGRGGGGGGPVTITQTAADITIGMNTYKLDGTAVDIQGRGGATSKAKAMWDGSNLVITTTSDVQGTAIEQKAVRSLSADGKEMTVVTTTSGGPAATTTGAGRKQVYTKG